jgi:hypothetical protein
MTDAKSKPAKYRIVEWMGKFVIQESRLTIFGNVKWATWQRGWMFEAGFCSDHEFDTFKEAKKYLTDILSARAMREKLEKRGPVVHLEVTDGRP